jgi:hypothetical protein
LANETQHDYYRAARAHKAELEKSLDLGELALSTTRGMGGAARRWGSVTILVRGMLSFLALGDAVGIILSLNALF